MLGKYRVAETRFYQALDRFRVIRFHQHARRHTDFAEKSVDDQPHIASLRIKKEWNVGEFCRTQRPNMTAAHFVGGRPNDEQLFVEEWDQLQVGLGDGKRNESQVEAPLQQSGDHFFRDAYRHANFRFRIILSKLPQRTAQLVDQRGHAGGEMEWTRIFRQIVFKYLLDVPHHSHDFFCVLREPQCCRRGDQAFSSPHEKVGVKFVSKVMQLQAYGARRQVNLFRSARHAGRIHDGEEELELVDIHLQAPSCDRRAHKWVRVKIRRLSFFHYRCFLHHDGPHRILHYLSKMIFQFESEARP